MRIGITMGGPSGEDTAVLIAAGGAGVQSGVAGRVPVTGCSQGSDSVLLCHLPGSLFDPTLRRRALSQQSQELKPIISLRGPVLSRSARKSDRKPQKVRSATGDARRRVSDATPPS